MIKRGNGGLIFVSSKAVFLPMPLRSHYSASKVYDLHLANGLCHELKDKGIDVLALCPGHTRTEFSEIAGIKDRGYGRETCCNPRAQDLGNRPHVVPGIGEKIIALQPRLISMRRNIDIGAMAVKGMVD
jgi:hypothetical protein